MKIKQTQEYVREREKELLYNFDILKFKFGKSDETEDRKENTKTDETNSANSTRTKSVKWK